MSGRQARRSALPARAGGPRSSTLWTLLAAVAGILVLVGAMGTDALPGAADDDATPVTSSDPGRVEGGEILAPTDPPASPDPTPSPGRTDAAQPSAASALATVPLLEVKGRAPRTRYERDLFGSGWVDVDRNGCDTRNDVLARDLTGTTFKPGTHDCVVLTGTLADPFSGTTITFQRGDGTSDDVQIDHVVALSDAWQKGAQGWDETRRVAFANDPLNLLAVDGPLNMQKGDGDAATWLPPNKPSRCAYVARQVAVKHAYGLWVTAAERDAMAGVLTGCPGEPLPGPVSPAVTSP